MTIQFRPAVRENVPLLIGLAGGTGSGKTLSAMRLAKGIAGDHRFAVVDTENGRAKLYADFFDFDSADLREPFSPDAYSDHIRAAVAHLESVPPQHRVIVVDSMSHEHAGVGGLLDWHEQELSRMAGDDWKKRDALTMSAWIKPKAAHKKMVTQTLLTVEAHIVLCFRAAEQVEMAKENGKTVVRPKQTRTGRDGWHPICERNLPFELTMSFLVTDRDPGVPLPIKLMKQHRPFFPDGEQITEKTGELLAGWAANAPAPTPEPEPKPETEGEPDRQTTETTVSQTATSGSPADSEDDSLFRIPDGALS